MTFEQLQAQAKTQRATYVNQLYKPWQRELLAMVDYTEESYSYEAYINYVELHNTLLTSKIDDLGDFFKAFEDVTNGKRFGVIYKTCEMERTDVLNDNGKGFLWEDAYIVALQLRQATHYARVYEMSDYEITA